MLPVFGTAKGTRNTKESLGQALASGAHPRRIYSFESICRNKNNPNPQMWFGLFFFGFGGNYGYNSRQQFGECTPHVNSVPPGVLLYPSTNFCTPSDKSVPQEVPGIPELSVR